MKIGCFVPIFIGLNAYTFKMNVHLRFAVSLSIISDVGRCLFREVTSIEELFEKIALLEDYFITVSLRTSVFLPISPLTSSCNFVAAI